MYSLKLRKSKSLYNNFRKLKVRGKLGISRYNIVLNRHYKYKNSLGHIVVYNKSGLVLIKMDFKKFRKWVLRGASCDLLLLFYLDKGGFFELEYEE